MTDEKTESGAETQKTILTTLRRLEDFLAGIDRDMAKDRQMFQDLLIEIKSVGEEMGQLRGAVNLTAERTRDKVAEAVAPMIDSADNLTTQIKRKKMVLIKEKTKNKLSQFFDKFRR